MVYQKKDPSRSAFLTDGVVLGLGKRLQWPDDYFTLYQAASFQIYKLDNYARIFFRLAQVTVIITILTTTSFLPETPLMPPLFIREVAQRYRCQLLQHRHIRHLTTRIIKICP